MERWHEEQDGGILSRFVWCCTVVVLVEVLQEHEICVNQSVVEIKLPLVRVILHHMGVAAQLF